VEAADDFDVVGIPTGTPLDFQVLFGVSARSFQKSGVEARISEGTMNEERFRVIFSGSVDSIITLNVHATAGEVFRISSLLSVGTSEGSVTSEARYEIRGLPEGATAVSCQGYRSDVAGRVESGTAPGSFLLLGPNPSSSTVRFQLASPASSPAEVLVYDVAGALVRSLCHDRIGAGITMLEWDGRDYLGRKVPPGLYFTRAQLAGWKATRTVVFTR
jgi:hypothetical protein